MLRFVKNILIFLVIPIILFGLNISINKYFSNNEPLDIKRSKVLICGDSHTQKGINPVFFNDAQNISQSAEPYVLSFWKLRKIFNNYLPDTIILGFGPHNFARFNDFKFKNKKLSEEMFKRSYSIEMFENVSNKIPIDYKKYYLTLWKQTGFFPKRKHQNYLGNYSNVKTTNLSSLDKIIDRHYGEKGISIIAEDYLDSISNLCSLNGVKLILLNTPVHRSYRENIPKDVMKKFIDLKNKYEKNNLVLDKSLFFVEDSLFRDSDHLNEFGAKKFTKKLIHSLNIINR